MPEFPVNRPTWVEINLDNLAFNFHSIKKFIGSNVEFMAIVKADAYGHGAVECARRLESEGVAWLGVALVEEALELRENNVKSPILCLGSFWAGQEKKLLENNITPVVYQIETARLMNEAALEFGVTADIHVKIDTGMGRIGVRFSEVEKFAEEMRQFKNLRIDGIMSHLAAADNLSENDFTLRQISNFNESVAIFHSRGFKPTYLDLANSPGAVAHREARNNLVRIGGILYGLGDDVLPEEVDKPDLKPVLSLRTRITHLKVVSKGETLGYGRTFMTQKDSIIATIPIGYHDGYRRALSNKARVIINNSFAPVVGTISMDWTILDVSDLPGVKVNDEVILIGQSDKLKVTAEELAGYADTISYEITCGIIRRVKRKYAGSEKKFFD